MKYLIPILKYHTPSFLVKNLYKVNQNKNEKIENQINDSLIQLKNSVIRKEIQENENANKVINILEKILDFNKQHKGR